MKVIEKILALLAALSLITVLLISAAEAAVYMDFNYYQKEYEKYEVLNELQMSMDDVMDVTHKMMSYLRGDREELSVITEVDGRKQDFFNEQDRFHMEEVRNIFCKALEIRRIAIIFFLVSLFILFVANADWKRSVASGYIWITGMLTVAAGVLAVLMMRNFNQCFVIFHEIFFDNDLWMFDPETDYMIRMLPEGLFADFAARIGLFAGGVLLIFLIIAIILYRMAKKKQEDRELFCIS